MLARRGRVFKKRIETKRFAAAGGDEVRGEGANHLYDGTPIEAALTIHARVSDWLVLDLSGWTD